MDQWIILISVAYLSRLNYSYLPVLVTLSLSLLPFHGGNDENMRESQVGENIQIFANSFYTTGKKRINKEEMQCWHFLLLLSITRAHYIKIKASTFCFFHSTSTVAIVTLGRNYCTNATEINPHNRHNWTKVTKFTMQLNNATLIKLLYTTYFTIFRAYYYPHPKTFLFSFFSMYFG